MPVFKNDTRVGTQAVMLPAFHRRLSYLSCHLICWVTVSVTAISIIISHHHHHQHKRRRHLCFFNTICASSTSSACLNIITVYINNHLTIFKINFRSRHSQDTFLYSNAFGQALELTPSPIDWVPKRLFPGLMRQGV